MLTQREFGTYLRTLRENRARPLTQRQLAGELNVDNSYISKIETGIRRPPPNLLIRIASSLQVDQALLLIQAGYLELPGLRQQDLSQSLDAQLRNVWESLIAQDRLDLVSYARYLIVRRQFLNAVPQEAVSL